MINYEILLVRLTRLRYQGQTSFDALIKDLQLESTQKVSELLSNIVNSEDFVIKCEALEVMANIDNYGFQQLAAPMLKSENKFVRQAVCSLLGEYPGPISEDILLAHLPDETDVDARGAAVESLELIGSLKSIGLLSKLSEEDHFPQFDGWLISQLAENAIQAINSSSTVTVCSRGRGTT